MLVDVLVDVTEPAEEDADVVAVSVAVVGGGGGAVPREGVGLQVETWRPCVRDARPSGCRGSLNPGGRLPTIEG